MLSQALEAVGGNTTDRDALIDALANVELQSPRGLLRFSDSHHPIQNIYLREIRNGRHEVLEVAHELLEAPDSDCRM